MTRCGFGSPKRPRLVVTDIFMPKNEGVEAILELCRDYPDTKITAMSSRGVIGGAGRWKMARQLGAHDAIALGFQDLLTRVHGLIAGGTEGVPA